MQAHIAQLVQAIRYLTRFFFLFSFRLFDQVGLLGFLAVIALTTAKALPKEKVANEQQTKSTAKIEPPAAPRTPTKTKGTSLTEAETEALKAAKMGEFGTVATPAGRRSTRIASSKAAKTPVKAAKTPVKS